MRNSPLVHRALFLAAFLLPSGLPAQANPRQRPVCWLAAPQASCKVIVVTEFGAYASAGNRPHPEFDPPTGQFGGYGTTFRVKARGVADWGFLVNVSGRDALGATMLGGVETGGDDDRAELALFVRYRHWLNTRRSLDFAIGTPIMRGNADDRPSPYGLMKLNLDPRFGIALRPELHRTLDFSDPAGPRTRTNLFMSAGIEIGHKPGFGLGVLGGGILFILTVIAISHSD